MPSRLGTLAAGLGLVLTACSADSADVPEPAVDQVGTFIAQQAEPARYRLFRVRNSLRLDVQRTYLFLDEYAPGAASVAEARALAQNHELSLLPIDIVLLQDFVKVPYVVVWHRSLEPDELD